MLYLIDTNIYGYSCGEQQRRIEKNMKRILAVILLLATVLSLCGCDSGSQTVTPDKTPSSDTSDKTSSDPTQPDTSDKTPSDPTQPTEPQKSEAVLNVESQISSLGEITDSSEETYARITGIQAAYDALTKSEQAQVENYSVLEAAVKTYDNLVRKAEAAKIEAAIANMGQATYKNRQAVIDAMKLYNAAEKNVQALVSNADALKDAAFTVAKVMQDAMYKEEDFVRGMSFYYHNQWPRGDEYWYADQRCFALPYLGEQGDSVWLRFVCNYTDDDWVFFKKIIFACDDQRFSKVFSYYDIVRDNDSGEVWEYIDMEANANEIEILEAIASSQKTVIRFQGDDYYNDFTVSAADKEAIRFTLDLYYLLGGK